MVLDLRLDLGADRFELGVGYRLRTPDQFPGPP